MSNIITQDRLHAGMSYSAYRDLINNLLSEGKTTGLNQGESYVEYTKLNAQRMRRLDKTVKLVPEVQEQLKQLAQSWVWVILTEGWCGDAAQSVPVLAKMAEVSPNIEFYLLLRDEHLDIMDAHLTNGARSIPKLICLNDKWETLGTWGPRPATAQQILYEYREKYGEKFREHYAEFSEQLQLWYARDRTQSIQQELAQEIANWRTATSS